MNLGVEVAKSTLAAFLTLGGLLHFFWWLRNRIAKGGGRRQARRRRVQAQNDPTRNVPIDPR